MMSLIERCPDYRVKVNGNDQFGTKKLGVFVRRTKCWQHITPTLMELHWLPL
jgi:hypothetical protein